MRKLFRTISLRLSADIYLFACACICVNGFVHIFQIIDYFTKKEKNGKMRRYGVHLEKNYYYVRTTFRHRQEEKRRRFEDKKKWKGFEICVRNGINNIKEYACIYVPAIA